MRLSRVALALLLVAACGAEPDDAVAPIVVLPGVTPQSHPSGPPAWLAQGDACRPVPTDPLVLPKTDKWSGLIEIKDPSDTLWLTPLHVNVTIEGQLLMYGFSRTSGDNSPLTLDVSPTFLFEPSVANDVPTITHADIYGVPFDGVKDSFACAGHTQLTDGRIMTTGGTRIAQHSQSPIGTREFGLTYAALFDRRGWMRIPRDFIGGESWYPTLMRLSDGRLIQYSGYYELDAVLASARITFNRTVQLFDPTDLDDPWRIISPSSSTPVGTEPVNYTWIWELPTPIQAAGRERQLFMMGSGGATYLFNHADAFADPAERFVARSPRIPPPDPAEIRPAAASTVMIAPFYHDADRLSWRPGSVLVIGGGTQLATKRQLEVYDPYVDKWCPLSKPLDVARRNSTGVYLPDGNILLVNGELNPPGDPALPQLTPTIVDPRTGKWTNVAREEPLNSTRGYHSVAALLPDGRVFAGGGRTYRVRDAPDERTDARIYSPYYLGILPPSDRPAIIGIPKDPIMHYDAEYEVDYKNGAIDGAALIGLAAMTHATDFNGRYVDLTIVRGGPDPRGKLVLRGPAGPRIVPPGHYMLFLTRKVDGVSVPSVAQIIRVDGANPTCEGVPTNACGGCAPLEKLPGQPCRDMCGAGVMKCDSPNRTSCNACL